MRILLIINIILASVSVFSQTSKFIGKFHLDNDTIIINPDTTFKISIQGHDSLFFLRREIYTGKGQIDRGYFKFVKFDQDEQDRKFWKCSSITLKNNKLYGQKCNLTSSENIYKRIRKAK